MSERKVFYILENRTQEVCEEVKQQQAQVDFESMLQQFMELGKKEKEPDEYERELQETQKPTDLQVCGKGGTVMEEKRQNVESGERSLGMVRGRTALVVRKKPVARVTPLQSAAGALNGTAKATASCSQTPSARSGSSLGLLVPYSDSDQSDSN